MNKCKTTNYYPLLVRKENKRFRVTDLFELWFKNIFLWIKWSSTEMKTGSRKYREISKARHNGEFFWDIFAEVLVRIVLSDVTWFPNRFVLNDGQSACKAILNRVAAALVIHRFFMFLSFLEQVRKFKAPTHVCLEVRVSFKVTYATLFSFR